MTIDELMCLGVLEALEGGHDFPDGGDSHEMERQGLIGALHGGRWAITLTGRLRLQNLRSVLSPGD